MSVEVLCVGEAMVQVSPEDGARLAEATRAAMSVGGAEANVAVGLARAGHVTGWASALGADPLGDAVVARLTAEGVSTELVERRADAVTGVYFKDAAPDGTRAYYYRRGSAASRLGPEHVRRWARTVRPRVVHVTGITSLLSASSAAAVSAIVEGRAFGDARVSFDVNMRTVLADPSTPETLWRLAAASDLVFVGRDEAQGLWGTAEADDVRALLPDVPLLVVKDGGHEAVAFAGARRVAVPALPARIVEATGAGDAFAAGWLDAELRGLSVADALSAGHRLAVRALATHADIPERAVQDEREEVGR